MVVGSIGFNCLDHFFGAFVVESVKDWAYTCSEKFVAHHEVAVNEVFLFSGWDGGSMDGVGVEVIQPVSYTHLTLPTICSV